MNIQLFLLRLDKLLQAIKSWRLTKALLAHRVLAGAEHRYVLSRNFDTIVDIGANRGQFALAARRWSPQSKVISFEPLPQPAELFRRIFSDDSLVTLHEAAIGPSSQLCKMHVSERDDSSSLLPISALQATIFPGTAEAGTIEVRVAPLDNFVTSSQLIGRALLKLDVQGFEFEALAGCQSLLPHFDVIYCECSFIELYSGQKLAPEVISWLAQNGFALLGVYNPAYDANGRFVQADLLFERLSPFSPTSVSHVS